MKRWASKLNTYESGGNQIFRRFRQSGIKALPLSEPEGSRALP